MMKPAYCAVKLIRAAAILLPLFIFARTAMPQSSLRLVESVPDETQLTESDIDRTIDVWLEMFNSARNTIDIETFYFSDSPGSQMNRIISSLKSAAGRGVKIRIIVDSSFYAANERASDQLEEIPNIEIRRIPMRNISGGVMHAKYFIVDGEKVFAGSQNMDWRALEHIHEMGAVVNDRAVALTFNEIFEADWMLCVNNNYGILNQRMPNLVNAESPSVFTDPAFGEVTVYPVISPYGYSVQGVSHELDELLRVIDGSMNELNIQIYSYSLRGADSSDKFNTIDSALRAAAGRGVKVRMLIPDWAMRPGKSVAVKDLSTAENFEIRIVSFPLHTTGFIPYSRVDHCKYFTCDSDISWVGSANWERNYFYNSRNISLVIKNKPVNDRLKEVFELVWNSPYSEKVDINREYKEVKRN